MAPTLTRRWRNMATQMHIKLKEDEHRLMLENGIKAMLSSQEKVIKTLAKLVAQHEKEKPNVKAKTVRK